MPGLAEVRNKFFSHFGFIKGSVAEWLGRALQKLVQRFESARYLPSTLNPTQSWIIFLSPYLLYLEKFQITSKDKKMVPTVWKTKCCTTILI